MKNHHASCLKNILFLVLVFSLTNPSLQLAMEQEKEAIKQTIKQMVATDQTLRSQITSTKDHATLWAEVKKIDKEHTTRLKAILSNLDPAWLTISQFGKEADNDAWLLVQHADHDLEFQKLVLYRLEKLTVKGETNPTNVASLYDRIAVNEKRPQKYGTQFLFDNGQHRPYEIEDPANIATEMRSNHII